eukprot:878767-Amphidinium_carterae.2
MKRRRKNPGICSVQSAAHAFDQKLVFDDLGFKLSEKWPPECSLLRLEGLSSPEAEQYAIGTTTRSTHATYYKMQSTILPKYQHQKITTPRQTSNESPFLQALLQEYKHRQYCDKM